MTARVGTLTTMALFLLLAGCDTAPDTMAGRQGLADDAAATVQRFRQQDPSMNERFSTASGYAVFPSVGKGAAGIGGAYGRGVLYEKGQIVGYCDVSQATLGVQLGGQAYSEVIFFEDALALNNFKAGNLSLAAQVSAVAAKAGASADADYENGVLVFTMTRGGLMYEASVGGQRFSFVAN